MKRNFPQIHRSAYYNKNQRSARLWNKSNKMASETSEMPSQLLNPKAVEEFLPGTALEGPQDAAGP
jgi:hypothetical protein